MESLSINQYRYAKQHQFERTTLTKDVIENIQNRNVAPCYREARHQLLPGLSVLAGNLRGKIKAIIEVYLRQHYGEDARVQRASNRPGLCARINTQLRLITRNALLTDTPAY